jgi:ornithine carbamoyltransferase
MSFNLKKRNFLTLEDFTSPEINYLIKLSRDLKQAKYAGTEQQLLRGKNIALIFEKNSTRTRCAFEVAAFDQGAHVTYLGPKGSHLHSKETMKDTARVLGRMFDGIEYRGFSQKIVEELAAYAGVTVWNGLTTEHHPTQTLADLLTMQEHSRKPLKDISLCFLGNGDSNIGNSLMVGAAKMGIDFRMATPEQFRPHPTLIERCQIIAHENEAKILLTDNIQQAVQGVDFLYTDVWVSMEEPDSMWAERIPLLLPFQVNRQVLAMTHNPYVKFMHCLPAYHNRDSEMGEKIFQQYGLDGAEVTEEVFESAQSIVFDQAENRLHTIKAVMVATL